MATPTEQWAAGLRASTPSKKRASSASAPRARQPSTTLPAPVPEFEVAALRSHTPGNFNSLTCGCLTVEPHAVTHDLKANSRRAVYSNHSESHLTMEQGFCCALPDGTSPSHHGRQSRRGRSATPLYAPYSWGPRPAGADSTPNRDHTGDKHQKKHFHVELKRREELQAEKEQLHTARSSSAGSIGSSVAPLAQCSVLALGSLEPPEEPERITRQVLPLPPLPSFEALHKGWGYKRSVPGRAKDDSRLLSSTDADGKPYDPFPQSRVRRCPDLRAMSHISGFALFDVGGPKPILPLDGAEARIQRTSRMNLSHDVFLLRPQRDPSTEPKGKENINTMTSTQDGSRRGGDSPARPRSNTPVPSSFLADAPAPVSRRRSSSPQPRSYDLLAPSQPSPLAQRRGQTHTNNSVSKAEAREAMLVEGGGRRKFPRTSVPFLQWN